MGLDQRLETKEWLRPHAEKGVPSHRVNTSCLLQVLAKIKMYNVSPNQLHMMKINWGAICSHVMYIMHHSETKNGTSGLVFHPLNPACTHTCDMRR